ncbi:MAG TPA: flagellar basal body rod protein FlgC [Terracidiphilus sp.]|nr:flagellar basal body rod protein FlgC [Terracidiphilus sp.]
MNLFGVMEVSGSAMQAERMRAEVVAANMANAETTRTEDGKPYRRQMVVFAANSGDPNFLDSMRDATATGPDLAQNAAAQGALPAPPPLLHGGLNDTVSTGVHIAQVVQDTSDPLKRYDPGSPDAGPDGYVSYPNINPLTEMVDLMGATRAYGLNGSAVQAEKSMITSALEIAKS